MNSDKLFNNHKICVFILGLLILCSSVSKSYASGQFDIFILHSYSQEYPWTRSQHQGFISTLNSNKKTRKQISTEYLDTKRKSYTPEYIKHFTNYLRVKYADYKPDLIYVSDDNATQFALNELTHIFPATPVIFSGVNDFSILGTINRSEVTGVFEAKELAPNLDLVHAIDKSVDEILIVGDDSNTYRAIKRDAMEQLKNHHGIKATYIANKQIDNVTTQLRSSTLKYLFLTTIGGFINTDGKNLTLAESIAKISGSGKFIIISMEDTYLLDGVLGGYVTSGENQGLSAAELALKYERGVAIKDIAAILNSPNIYVFDYKELSKNNINLPRSFRQSAKIINKPISFYQRNKQLITASIITLTSLLIILMAVFLVYIFKKNIQIKKQTVALERAMDTLKSAQQLAHLGNWEWNINSGKTCWSDEIYRIFGLSPSASDCSFEEIISHIPADEKDIITAIIQHSIKTSTPYEVEHQIIKEDGSKGHVRQIGKVHKDPLDHSTVIVGTILDISSTKENEFRELDRLAKIERYQEALMEWSRVDYENLEQALQRATEISSNTLDVSRVSIWLYNDEMLSIKCQDLYQQDKGHEKGMELFKKDFPRYFEALTSKKMIVVNDARNDKYTNEFTEAYLDPNHIYSMLDAPIHYAGEMIGVVCHEHINEMREWTPQEQEFASAIASTVSLSLEVHKRKQTEKELEYQAYHDSLTNLPNRMLFKDRLEQALMHAKRNNNMLAVLFLDLDNFKSINDSLGHSVGDQILIGLAERLRMDLRETDTIARLGGDEFTLIVSDVKEVKHVHDIVLKLFNILQQPFNINDQALYATSSIGISIFPNDGDSPDTLISNADAAMYKAKDTGRNSFEFYTHDMTEKAFERVIMETNLRKAIEQGEFCIHYQPQYDASTNYVKGMEALIRWQHPEMGLVSPAKFIPIAESTGLIVEIDRWVMKTASSQFADWYRQGFTPGRLSLNMAAKQLEQEDLLKFIKENLKSTESKAEWLSIEVTESQIMKDPEKAILLLQEISDLGIKIAVDDFGTGYSSLTYLKRLPVDQLKIDQAFINEIPHDDDDIAIVRAIIALSNSLNLEVIAEGVEKLEQVEFLIREGCKNIQGFYFAKPMPAEAIDSLLQNQLENLQNIKESE